MIKDLFFKLIEVVLFFKPKNLDVLSREDYLDGTVCTEYYYGTRSYKCIGIPVSPPSGFFLPVKEATHDGKDITELFKEYAGPKCNHVPDTGYIFYRMKPHFNITLKRGGISFGFTLKKCKGESNTVIVKNILNQVSVFGAK
jgi:hypothetical protein